VTGVTTASHRPSTEAPELAHPFANDLNWLLHRVAAGLGNVEDDVSRRHGLGIRAFLVLSTIASSPPLTQLALGQQLGLDKTAVTSVLDRLEAGGWIIRLSAPGDRRARVPEATKKGRELATTVSSEIRDAEASILAALSPDDTEHLRTLLQRLAFGPFADAAPISGSCI
jgi:DNA-binding MarR family transcriptional regulator